jgi:hypothetical protein
MSTVINVDAVAGLAIASQTLSRMAPLTSDMRTEWRFIAVATLRRNRWRPRILLYWGSSDR